MHNEIPLVDIFFDIGLRGFLNRLFALLGQSDGGPVTIPALIVLTLAAIIGIPLAIHIIRRLFEPDAPLEPAPLLFNSDLTPATAQNLVGCEGVVAAPLRPLGVVKVEGRAYTVKSEGHYIEPGATVVIDRIEGPHIIVVPVEESE